MSAGGSTNMVHFETVYLIASPAWLQLTFNKLKDKHMTAQHSVKRIIGIDIHPRCFAAAALTVNKKQLWLHPRIEMTDLKQWLEKNVMAGDILVLESGSNSFSFAKKVIAYDVQCVVLDSVKVGKISKSYLKTDKQDAVKIGKIYLSGLADEVWQPDKKTVLRRQVLSKYVQCNKTITKTKNMIKSFLIENGINFPKGKKIYSPAGRQWLQKHLSLIHI